MSDGLVPFVPSDHFMKEAYEKNQKSLFFAILPPELRLAIYSLATSYEWDIYPKQYEEKPDKFRHRYDHSDPEADPIHKSERLDYSRLKTVSRQFYHELEYSGVFYKVNNFVFKYIKDLQAFLTTISPEKRGQIRSITVKDELPGDEIHRDWRARTPVLNEDASTPALDEVARTAAQKEAARTLILDKVVDLLKGCNQLRHLTFDMIDIKAGACVGREDWMTLPFTYYADTLLESIKMQAQDSSQRVSERDSEKEKETEVIYSEGFWKFPQFRLNMHVGYFVPPDEGDTSRTEPYERDRTVIDLTDTSDLQWLRTAPEQQKNGDYFGQPCGPLVEQGFRNLVLETKLAVDKYRIQLFLPQSQPNHEHTTKDCKKS